MIPDKGGFMVKKPPLILGTKEEMHTIRFPSGSARSRAMLEEIAAFTPGTPNEGKICPCGCRKYRPTNMRWFHWFLPRVVHFAYLRIRGVA